MGVLDDPSFFYRHKTSRKIPLPSSTGMGIAKYVGKNDHRTPVMALSGNF